MQFELLTRDHEADSLLWVQQNKCKNPAILRKTREDGKTQRWENPSRVFWGVAILIVLYAAIISVYGENKF